MSHHVKPTPEAEAPSYGGHFQVMHMMWTLCTEKEDMQHVLGLEGGCVYYTNNPGKLRNNCYFFKPLSFNTGQ